MNRLLLAIAAFATIATTGVGHAQIVASPQGIGGGQGMNATFGGLRGISQFSPVHGAAPMNNNMAAQQQMAQIYMLYGMMGGMRNNVQTGPPNPFIGGYGMGNFPSLDGPMPATSSPNGGYKTADRKAELRAQRAEQKKQAKAKAKPAPKATAKANHKKAGLDQQ